jgi:hypothetical protein
MVDVALMRDLGSIPSIFNVTSYVLKENLIFRLAFPSEVAKKYVDAEDRSKTTHQRGSWTPKMSHKTCNAARVTSLIDLEINRTDVELVLGRNSSRTTPGRIRRGEARGGSPKTSKGA